MSLTEEAPSRSQSWFRSWPWLLLAVMTLPAVWHVVHFPDDVDFEFPKVVRPTFNALPPPSYRLAEPGDTIDRVAIYVSSIAIVLSTSGLALSRGSRRLWVAGLVLSLSAFWFAANPVPTFDGWHGLGWASVADPSAPKALRIGLAGLGLVVAATVLACARPFGLVGLWRGAREKRVAGLAVAAGLLSVLRIAGLPRVQPFGYWPRWEFVLGLAAFSCLLLRVFPRANLDRRRLVLQVAAGLPVWYGLVLCGIWLTWYHRPIERLRTVVPGRIYMSAMPTYKGLVVAQQRHHFKTIINLFPEDTPLRSPRHPDELRFAKGHGVRYVGSPSDVSSSNAFLDLTLRLSQDPDAWPILVHCHGCMDRTPAWVGIYRFVVEGQPLDEIMRFIEQHRGYRPKASVTLLYNRVLSRLAPARALDDPTAARLREHAGTTIDPYFKEVRAERRRASTRPDAAGALAPNLTPRR